VNLIRKIVGIKRAADPEIYFHVRFLRPGNYGVVANEVIIAVHKDRVVAQAHCRRLMDQQAQDALGGDE